MKFQIFCSFPVYSSSSEKTSSPLLRRAMRSLRFLRSSLAESLAFFFVSWTTFPIASSLTSPSSAHKLNSANHEITNKECLPDVFYRFLLVFIMKKFLHIIITVVACILPLQQGILVIIRHFLLSVCSSSSSRNSFISSSPSSFASSSPSESRSSPSSSSSHSASESWERI